MMDKLKIDLFRKLHGYNKIANIAMKSKRIKGRRMGWKFYIPKNYTHKIKNSEENTSFGVSCKSERRDLNPRPLEPHSSALPGCATFR